MAFDDSLVTQGSQSSRLQSSASQLSLCVCVCVCVCVPDSTAPWTAACQASLSMGFSRQEYQTRLPFPSPGHPADSGIEPHVSCIAGRFFTTEPPMKPSFLGTAAAAAKSLQSCPTLCDPIDSSLPSSPSLRFSRQEHWSGLPFPSPM